MTGYCEDYCVFIACNRLS
uniref:Uncharacterized protein n=1 Tax=Anguilla anguilla TaxID=7936 RepID=A0A0E9UKI8_ANGAN